VSDPARGAEAPSIVRSVIRMAVLGLLVAAPLAFGSVHRPAYIPLLVVAIASGIAIQTPPEAGALDPPKRHA
jgi:hypothetical protein